MNWRRDDQPLFGLFQRTDFFAPESVLTVDGRRVMWAWLTSAGPDDALLNKTIQSLPRELSLADDGTLRIKPLSELEQLRFDVVTFTDVTIGNPILKHGYGTVFPPTGAPNLQRIVEIEGDAIEIRIVIPRNQAMRKLFGFALFGDGEGGGLPIIFRPETGTLRVGATEAPFAVAELSEDEDVELRIFVDSYLVEVFVSDRQALVSVHMDSTGELGLDAFSVGSETTISRLDVWKMKPTNQGFHDAQSNRIWEPSE